MIILNYQNPKTLRSYQLALDYDLLGDLTLTSFNSGSLSKGIGRRIHVQADLEEGLKSFMVEHNIRCKHHYEVVN